MPTTQIGGKDFRLFDGWILWRVKGATVTDDDTDYAGTHVSPTASELFQFGRLVGGKSHGENPPNSMQIMAHWIGASGEILAPDDHSVNKRGLFDLTILEVQTLEDEAGTETTTVVDSTTETSCTSDTIYIIPMSQGKYWPRLTNITAPTGGVSAATELQIWCKPHTE